MDTRIASLPPDYLLAQMGWVRELARSLLGNSTDADDVAQEVWLAASQRPPLSASNPRAWLTVVTRHIVHRQGRAEARRLKRESMAKRAENEPRDDDVLARGETSQRLVAAVMALEEPYRSTVLRRYLDGLGAAEIAARDRVTEAAVRKRLSRAMQQLRAQLDKEFEGGRAAWISALLDMSGARKFGVATALEASVGVLLMLKKVAILVIAVALLACSYFFAPAAGRWLGLSRSGGQATSAPIAATNPPAREDGPSMSGATVGTRESLQSTSVAGQKSIAVDGVVLNLAYPDSTRAPAAASGVGVRLSLQSLRLSAQTQTGADGRFHLELADPGTRPLYASLSAEGDADYRPRSDTFEVKLDTTFSDRHLERSAHGDLVGVVVDDEGKPFAGIAVQIGNSGGMTFGPDSAPGSRVTQPDSEVITDANGAFLFRHVHSASGFYPGSPSLVALHAGYRMLPIGGASMLLAGGWSDVRIRMIPTGGRLIARVHDEHGRPEAGARLGITVSKAEPGANWEAWSSDPGRVPVQGVTDEQGLVVLEDLWINKRLELSVATTHEAWTCERARDGRLDVQHAELGTAIVVPASKSFELEIVLPSSIRLRGKVVDPSGVAVHDANVTLCARGPQRDGMISSQSFTSDENGAFGQGLRRPTRTVSFEISAYTGQESFGPLENLSIKDGRLIARRTLEVTPDSPDELLVEVELQPALTISGTVHEVDGSACKGRVAAIPAGAFEGNYTRGAGQFIRADGHFEIGGLLPGTYDLDVRPNRNFVFTDCLLSQRFSAVAAGSSGVELALGESQAVNVVLDVAASDGAVAAMAVVTGVFHPYELRDTAGHVPDGEKTFNGLSGWPPGATLNFGGQTGDADEQGLTGFLHMRGDLPIHRLRPMNAGWYWLGIDASDSAGQRYHTCGTGLVYLAPGSYRFHFDLVRQTHIEGRITNADSRGDLSMGLVTREGKAIQVLRTNRHLDEVVSIGAGGHFSLEGAPVGEYRLRIGSEVQLRAGAFIYEVPLTIYPAENAPLILQLP